MKLRELNPVYILAERRHLREENARLRAAIENPILTGINLGNGSMGFDMEGLGPKLLTGMFIGLLDKGEAMNYCEVQMYSMKHGPILVHVQKQEGKSPAELVKEAKAENVKLLEWIEQALDYTSSPSWSPSLTMEGNTLIAQANVARVAAQKAEQCK